MANIRDVAAAAGVSLATASRAFQVDTRVSPELRERVMGAAKELGYIFQPRTTKSRNGKGYLLVMTGRVGYWGAIFEGIAQQAAAMDYIPVVQYLPYAWGIQEVENLLSLYEKQGMNVEGVVLNASFTEEQYSMMTQKRPTVLCGQCFDINGAISVSSDNFRAATELAGTILDQGYSRPMIITNAKADASTQLQQREEGYRYACAQRGITSVPCITESEREDELVHKTVDMILSMESVPDLLLFTRAEETLRFRMVLAQRGIRVPADLRLASFDIDLLAGGTLSGVDYVRQDFHQFGTESVRILDGYIRGEVPSGRKLFVDHAIHLVKE